MEHSTVTVNDLSMDYCTFGSGSKTLVILPGASVSKVCGAVEAIAQEYALFTDDFTVYVFDRKNGFEAPYPVEQMAHDTACAMEALGIGKSCILGASQGGSIALAMALKHPELVEKLVLASTSSRPNETMRACLGRWITLAESGDFDALARDMVPKFFTDKYIAQSNVLDAFLCNVSTQEDLRRFVGMLQAQLHFDIYDQLEHIDVPTLVIGAGEDSVLTPEASEEIADRLGHRLIIFENFRHAVYDELPYHRICSYEFFTGKKIPKPDRHKH